jgi:hypothetical protein
MKLPITSKEVRCLFTWQDTFEYEAGFLPEWADTSDMHMPLSDTGETFGRMLAHDAVEHMGLGVITCDPCAEELAAIGATVQNRRADFYNRYTGHDGLGMEVGMHLYGLLDSLKSPLEDRPRYYSPEIWEELADAWDSIAKQLNSYDEPLGLAYTKHQLLKVACAWMSCGYIRAERVDKKYGAYSFGNGFYRLKELATEAAPTLIELGEMGCHVRASVDFDSGDAALRIVFPRHMDDDQKRYIKSEHTTKWHT